MFQDKTEKSFTPSFASIKIEPLNITKERLETPKFIFLVGGLAGSGKTCHLLPLINKLKETLALSVNYLDKDAIGKTMNDASSAQIYAEMIARALKASEEVIIHEGNILGNFSLFREYILSESKNGATVICLDFQCADAKIQHERLLQRAQIDSDARQRDLKKLDYDYYISTDRPGEIARRDKELTQNQDLLDSKIINLRIIETSKASVQANVDEIVKFITELNPGVIKMACESRKLMSA